MNFINRSLLSIRKRMSRSIILFLAVLLICNVMAGAVSIKKALIKTEELYSIVIPVEVSIEENYLESEDRVVLSDDIVKSIGSSQYVKDYKYYYDYYLQSKGLKLNNNDIQMKDEEMIAYLEIKGAGSSKLDLVENGTLKIIEGRLFNTAEIKNASNVIVISKEIAEYNNLNIGDKLTLGNNIIVSDKNQFISEDYEIIGIFEAKKEYERDATGELIEMANNYLDVMFMPNDAIKNIHEKITLEAKKNNLNPYDSFHAVVRYVLRNVDDLDYFKNENMNLLPKGFVFADNSENLTSLSAPVENMKDISNIIVYASIFTSIIVIGLISILFCKERKQEMGIYLALGERKIRIAMQILLETLIISFIAITISIYTGNIIAKNMSDTIIQNKITSDLENRKQAYGTDEPTITYDETLKQDYEIEIKYDISLDLDTVVYIYAIALGSIIISGIIPICYTLRLNPRKILM